MKKNIITALAVFVFILFSVKSNAQLHLPPACGENFTLDWDSTPTASNEFNWSPGGALSNIFNNVDGSGIDFTVTFTGDTASLGIWGSQTPKVGTSASGSATEYLDLYTSGLSATGITCTITFSSPIYALSFDLSHVNASGANGDKYTITATTTSGGTIYPTFTNSATPSYTTNNTTGIVNANNPSTFGTNAIVGVNFLDPDYITSVSFLWQDCNTCSTNNVHGSGLGNFSFCIPQTLDFDGVNDYINKSAFLGGKSQTTMMAWIKLDSGFDGGEIMGQKNLRLYIDSSRNLKLFARTNTGVNINSPNSASTILNTNLWYHVALKFDGSTGTTDLLLNGNVIWNNINPLLIGSSIDNSSTWNADHDFEIGRNTEFDDNYFEGSIYECRVYNKALTKNQLHRQINQEIENNSGNVRGTVIPKDIEGLLWSDLELYYKMGIIDTGFTPDNSALSVNGKLNNMRTYQERTAPLPYVTTTSCSGNWSNSSNWLHGDVWDISSSSHPECAIVKIDGNITTSNNHSTVGLIINSGSSLEINGNSELSNSWYLDLDGFIDLEGESQLVQTEDSTLEVTSSGTLERDQQGNKNLFSYNYWSSPVGKSNTTSNNNSYKLPEVLKDGTVTNTPLPINFLTSVYNGNLGNPGTTPIGIADYWIWKYVNKVSDNYASWQHVRSTGTLQAGEGYTMKGVENSIAAFSQEQNYTFNGKPNNGNISLALSTNNDYLIGNPYPSAIDANEFILDNISIASGGRATTNVINGTLYFWDHFAVATHNLAEYEGGYATYTLIGGIPAVSNDVRINATGGVGTKIPKQYIPVSQGFFVTADAGGTIQFKNSQRIFKTESADPSTFLKSSNTKSKNSNSKETDIKPKIRLHFDSPKGYHRQILVGIDTKATNAFDFGYDALLIDTVKEDMFWVFNNKNYVIQGVNNFDIEQKLPLGIKTIKEGVATIKIDSLENITSNTPIYLHDKELNIYHNLKQSNYTVQLIAGEYLNRFEITFSKPQVLSIDTLKENTIEVIVSNEKRRIIINNPNSNFIENIEMYNILGLFLFKLDIKNNEKQIEHKASQIETGQYILKIQTEYGKISKKILVK